MTHLQYKSLVTKETINYYLSQIEDDNIKKIFMSIISKFDVRISDKPIIAGNEFYYKMWILKRGTHSKAHIKDYYPIEMLQKNVLGPDPLSKVLGIIIINADASDDFEEYCEWRLLDPSDEINREDYLFALKRAARFKKFITQDDILMFSEFVDEVKRIRQYENKINGGKEEKIEFVDLDNETNLKQFGYSIIFLNDEKEYDTLVELNDHLKYLTKIVKSYGFDPYTGNFDQKQFPVTKEDKQIQNIKKDFNDYNQVLEQYNSHLRYLIQKYKIKSVGNTIKRLAFNLEKNVRNNEKQKKYKFINELVDNTFFY